MFLREDWRRVMRSQAVNTWLVKTVLKGLGNGTVWSIAHYSPFVGRNSIWWSGPGEMKGSNVEHYQYFVHQYVDCNWEILPFKFDQQQLHTVVVMNKKTAIIKHAVPCIHMHDACIKSVCWTLCIIHWNIQAKSHIMFLIIYVFSL